MITFHETVSRTIAQSLRGEWKNDTETFYFWLKPKINPEPMNSVDFVLSIDSEEKGKIVLHFKEDGVCYIILDGTESFKIHSLFANSDGEYCLRLVAHNGQNILLKKKEF